MHILQTVDQQQLQQQQALTAQQQPQQVVRSPVLAAWLHYVFDNPRNVPGFAYEEIARVC